MSDALVKAVLGVLEAHTVLDKAAHKFDHDNAKMATRVRHFTSYNVEGSSSKKSFTSVAGGSGSVTLVWLFAMAID